MLTIRACASKPSDAAAPAFKMPKRLVRARRVAESKRMDSFREIHEALKKTANQEMEFLKDFKTMFRDDAATDEEEAENAEE